MSPTTLNLDIYCEIHEAKLKARLVSRHPTSVEILVEPCEQCLIEASDE